jgi:hypothetical protein
MTDREIIAALTGYSDTAFTAYQAAALNAGQDAVTAVAMWGDVRQGHSIIESSLAAYAARLEHYMATQELRGLLLAMRAA